MVRNLYCPYPTRASVIETSPTALPPGTPRYKISDPALISQVKARWDALSKEERLEVTKDAMEELEDARQNKKYAQRQKPAAALGDVRRTASAIDREVREYALNTPPSPNYH